jgi:deoxyribodipyrimidine photo-lyase
MSGGESTFMRSMVWFRSDLRTADHAALHHASKATGGTAGVVGLFIICPDQWRGHDYAPVRVDLIVRTLLELSADLARLHIPLLIRTAVRSGDIPSMVVESARENMCSDVFVNREYEVDESRRDETTADLMRAYGLGFHSFHDLVAMDPASIRTGEGRFFSVFSPFRKAWLRRWNELGGVDLFPTPEPCKPTGIEASPVPMKVAGFESKVPADLWPAGERSAQKALKAFASRGIGPYKTDRDYPAVPGTSRMSTYLGVGSISTRQCLHAALEAAELEPTGLDPKSFEKMPSGPGHWLSEVVWREFFTHVLVGFPRVCMGRAFQTHTDRIVWSENKEHFRAWCLGRTGIPIVDAGMRQLVATGWMHNRLRMITAMFLTKNLFINWRWGERFFMQNLVDGYFASNNGGWQWSASTGTDAAPYFRIFNPVSQSQKFDESGAYIRQWVPELRGVEGAAVHMPYDEEIGLPPLGRGRLEYPKPIVDLSKSRDAAIKAFQTLREEPTASTA